MVINDEGREMPTPAQPLWRYLDFTKFVDLLISGSLFFSRIDKFEDPFEGTPVSGFLETAELIGDIELADHYREQRDVLRGLRQYSFVNSWHMNDYESAAMWKLYLQSNEGLAIRTTFRRLHDSFLDDRPVTSGIVKYVDFEDCRNRPSTLIDYLFLKRKSFEFENELRLFLLYDQLPGPEELKTVVRGPLEYGTAVRVDLSVLIQSIYISPAAPEWFEQLVKGLVAKITDLEFPIEKSSLGKLPK
ncbi:DUF2971 domain-containing protein [Edaphobacillus lindanitolerans]|uniref:DUF2971 domain-containing protein n=1 Tax=Edaphobacillus lindanitolerans TaxID=550447 RepID=A0A1U7PMF1_9BACI|nr:DUF2971 domain-containing protein [Edaphobacillus lindanitolerans]SIT84348.1 hypothetical protein SAMN05428946_1712 [Edaphobacillus lindanitolerans]